MALTRAALIFASLFALVACDQPAVRKSARTEPVAEVVQPECENPRTLEGMEDAAPGTIAADYVLTLRQGWGEEQDAAVVADLRERYRLDLIPVVGHPYIVRWSAALSPQQVARLRCEPAVSSIEHTRLLSGAH